SASADGKKVVTGSHDNTLKVWDVETGEAEQTMKGHAAPVRAVTFHPDGKRIISGSWDKTVRVWDRASGQQLSSFEFAGAKVERIGLLPDGKRLLVVGESAPRLYDLETGEELRVFGTQSGGTGLDVSRDGRLALVCGYGGAARLWDVETGVQLRQFSDHRGTVWSARFSPDGKQAITAGGGGGGGGEPAQGGDLPRPRRRPPPAAE